MSEEKKDTGKRTSIVLNWISVCQDLCSLNLVSPVDTVCGPHIESGCDDQLSSHPHSLSADATQALCVLLCENGLGGARCNNCMSSSTMSSSKSPVIRSMPDFNAICTMVRCEMTNVEIEGCSECVDTKVDHTPSSRMHRQGEGTSTPDWIGLCVVLCSQGQGGSACNCDKLPLRMAPANSPHAT